MTARKSTKAPTAEEPDETEEVDTASEEPEPAPKRDRNPPVDPFRMAAAALAESVRHTSGPASGLIGDDARAIVEAINALTLAHLSGQTRSNSQRRWDIYDAMGGTD